MDTRRRYLLRMIRIDFFNQPGDILSELIAERNWISGPGISHPPEASHPAVLSDKGRYCIAGIGNGVVGFAFDDLGVLTHLNRQIKD